jgi:hypothetical protein
MGRGEVNFAHVTKSSLVTPNDASPPSPVSAVLLLFFPLETGLLAYQVKRHQGRSR